MRALVWLGAAMATIGLIQFAFRFNIVAYIHIPGLVSHREEALGFRAREAPTWSGSPVPPATTSSSAP